MDDFNAKINILQCIFKTLRFNINEFSSLEAPEIMAISSMNI